MERRDERLSHLSGDAGNRSNHPGDCGLFMPCAPRRRGMDGELCPVKWALHPCPDNTVAERTAVRCRKFFRSPRQGPLRPVTGITHTGGAGDRTGTVPTATGCARTEAECTLQGMERRTVARGTSDRSGLVAGYHSRGLWVVIGSLEPVLETRKFKRWQRHPIGFRTQW